MPELQYLIGPSAWIEGSEDSSRVHVQDPEPGPDDLEASLRAQEAPTSAEGTQSFPSVRADQAVRRVAGVNVWIDGTEDTTIIPGRTPEAGEDG